MQTRLTIVGGGITGLAAAYLAARAGYTVTVIEGGAQFGGLLNTFPIGGSRLECFYHHFFTHDAELMWLLDELDLRDSLVFSDSTMGVFRDGRIWDFNTVADLFRFRPLSLGAKLRFAASSAWMGKFMDWRAAEGVPAMDWLARRAGREATDSIWRPLLEIKFGPYAREVPLAWMIGRLRQRMNSRKGAQEQLGYLNGSLSRLLDRLLERLRALGVTLAAGEPVAQLMLRGGRLEGVRTPRRTIEGGQYLFTIPSLFLPPLLCATHPAYAADLARIEYFGAVCTILEMDRPLSHIYWLNVADPGFPFGGVIEHTNLIAPAEYGGSHIAYLSRYFARGDELATLSPDAIAGRMIEPLARIFPDFRPSHVKNHYVFRTGTAATVCDLNFSARVPKCATPIENLYLATMAHIYPDERSSNNSIRVAAEALRVISGERMRVPKGASLSATIGF